MSMDKLGNIESQSDKCRYFGMPGWKNKELQAKYNEMHSQGSSAWFSDGREERETILKMGEPWKDLKVMEIGCGEGDLIFQIFQHDAKTVGIDYSDIAIKRARAKYPHQNFYLGGYRQITPVEEYFVTRADRIVMQGILEHLDDPFTELKWMIDNLLVPGGDVITSSPCFLNPRGIVWMTLDMLGAVMSKTDLHFLNPWDFTCFCLENGYKLPIVDYCDHLWANNNKMIEDFKQRIPLALKDGNIIYQKNKLDNFLDWLSHYESRDYEGATAIYRIKT